MAFVCTPSNYQQQQQLLVGGNMLLPQQMQFATTVGSSSSKQYQSIAPTPAKTVLGNSTHHNIQPMAAAAAAALLVSKKTKYTYMNMPFGEQLPSVARRNARERNRVKQVNNGFANLRQHLPSTVVNTLSNGGRGANKKLSKVDTLRVAVEYIRSLQDLLDTTGGGGGSQQHHYHNYQQQQQQSMANYDDSSLDGSQYGEYSPASSSPLAADNHAHHQHHHRHHHERPSHQAGQLRHGSFQSDASVSPTPSYSGSDISNGGADYFQPLKLEDAHPAQELAFKFEPFDTYEHFASDEQPDDDEELLDYISSWQEQ